MEKKIYGLENEIVKNVIYEKCIKTKDQAKIFEETRKTIFAMICKSKSNNSEDEKLKTLIKSCMQPKEEQTKKSLGFKKIF